jgi:hypothetical protein
VTDGLVPRDWDGEIERRARRQDGGTIAVTVSLVNTYGADYPDCEGAEGRPEA